MTTTRNAAAEPLRHSGFRWLLTGRFASYLGNAVAPVALAFAVLDLTGSVSDLGLVVGARSIANVLLLLFGGVLADRLPRALVLRGSSYAAALTQAVVAVVVLTHTATIPMLMVLGVLNGAVAGMSFPASAALTPQTVPGSLIRQANALLRLATNTALIGGTAIGGVLVAGVGPGWGIAVDAASFAVAGLCFSRIRVPDLPSSPGAATSTLTQLREGWGEFVSRTWVWVVVVAAMGLNAAYTGGIAVLGPAVADDSIGRRSWGIALAASTAGMLVGGLVSLRWQPRHALRLAVALSPLAALPLLALAYLPVLAALAAALFLTGLTFELFGVAWDVSMQEQVPAEKLARVYSYDAVGSFVAIPLGEILVGPIAHAYGVSTTLTWCAVLVVASSLFALCSRSVRTLTRIDQPSELLEPVG
ncbi:MFS transporter [Angustibacter sp. McL0619]|uniref:MFS transporter n=1 Tax=Angustibacter sp. McL0619 TaxID=3415676 RepID=UPI003CFA8EDE